MRAIILPKGIILTKAHYLQRVSGALTYRLGLKYGRECLLRVFSRGCSARAYKIMTKPGNIP